MSAGCRLDPAAPSESLIGPDERMIRMGTAEFAETAAPEAISGARTPRVAIIRRLALLAYAFVFLLWTLRYGIPVQRELVIAWTCGALACASIGRPAGDPPAGHRLAADRGAPRRLRLHARRGRLARHRRPLRADDRLRPLRLLRRRPRPSGCRRTSSTRASCTGTTSPSPCSTPPTSSSPSPSPGVLWARDRLAFLRFAKRLVTLASPAWRPTSPSPRRRPGWPPRTGLLSGVAPDHRRGLGGDRRPHRRRSSPRARRASTWSPPSPPCTPRSRPWSRSSSGAACVRWWCGRCWRSIRWRWA